MEIFYDCKSQWLKNESIIWLEIIDRKWCYEVFESSDSMIRYDRIMHNWKMNQLQALIIMTSNVEIGNWVNRKRLSLWLQMEKTSNEVKLLSQKRDHSGLFFISRNISESKNCLTTFWLLFMSMIFLDIPIHYTNCDIIVLSPWYVNTIFIPQRCALQGITQNFKEPR